MERKGRLGFVPARYGDGVVGGAEAVLREMAHGLAQRGWDVEILTTCARDHFTWANEFAPGTEEVADGVVLRRFPTVISTPRAERAALGAAILAGVALRLAEQERWINDDVRVPELFHYLLDEAERYRALVFAPYLFWPAFACGQVAPDRTILMPCLHDEPEAKLEIFRPIFSGSRRLWFLSDPERDLAEEIFPRLAPHEVIGSGLDVPEHYDVDGFRARHGITGRFVLFAGRREGGKNWERMLDAFAHAVVRENLPFSLVTMGHGEIAPAGGDRRPGDRPRLPPRRRARRRVRRRRRVHPAVGERELLAHDHGGLAGRHPRDRDGRERGQPLALRPLGCGARLRERRRVRAGAALRRRGARTPRPRSPPPGRDYVLEHYTWPPILDTVEASIDAWLPTMRILMVEPVPADA